MTDSTSAVLGRWGQFGRLIIGVEFVIAVALIIYAGLHDFSDVFKGAPAAVPVRIAASCAAADGTQCRASIVELNPGRFRIATNVANATLSVDLASNAPARAGSLLVRLAQPSALQLAIRPEPGEPAVDPIELTDVGRVVAPLPAAPSIALMFVSRTAADPAPIVIDELGVFEQSAGLLTDVRPMFPAIPPNRYHSVLVPRGIASLCLLTVLAAAFLPAGTLRRFSPVVLTVVCFSLCLLDLAILFSPYFARDLRTVYVGGALQDPAGSNLNNALHQAMRFLDGKGLTLMDGVVSWERMPGYALFCAAAGALFGHHTLLDLAMSAILLQTVFYSVAVGVFAWAAGSVFPPAAVWAVGMIFAWLPKELGLTQVDAIIAPVAVLMLAALSIRVKRALERRPVPMALDVAVHLTFALWFVMRPDVLPGWLVVSLLMHWKQWRRLLIPVTLFLVIGGAWGAYKARYTGEFTLTTTSAGASLFCGLFEVPSRFRYAMACTDEVYLDWIHQNTPYQPQTAAARSFATREVLKFWLTYPGHVLVMVVHKMKQMIDGDLWPGYPTQLQVFVFGAVPRYWLVLPLLTLIALTLAAGHQRERTLLLAWPLLLDAPLFWVMFASLGRFYSAVGVALVAAAVPLLFEREFYATVSLRPWRTASVLACAVVIAVGAGPVHDWLLGNDGLHYWSPFLNPAQSSLSVFK